MIKMIAVVGLLRGQGAGLGWHQWHVFAMATTDATGSTCC